MSYLETPRKHVKEVLKFLKKIGFKNVNGGDDFIIGGHQVDACGGHESTLLLLECTTQKDINSNIKTFRGKIPSINHGFRSHNIYKRYKRHIPILVVKYQKVTSTHFDYATKAKGPKIHIWDNNFISYYSNLTKTIDKYARYNLLAELGVKPNVTEPIITPSLRMTLPSKGKYFLFLFFIEAEDLLKIAYVARRELGDEHFYQRMIKKSRLKNIEEYINDGKVFPNSIIVALDHNSWDFELFDQKSFNKEKINLPNWLDFGKLKLINSYRSCWIIDGQHRLYSYAYTSVRGILAVSAFARLSEERQAGYFLDINREAKPVNPNLLWDLLGSLNPNSTKGIISNSVKNLRKLKRGFFENKINIPSMGTGRFNFNNICVTIERNEFANEFLPHLHENIKNPFWNKNYRSFEKNISDGINQYFYSFNETLNEEKRQMFSDGFISVMISLFKLLVTHLQKRPSLNEQRIFFKPISGYINSCNKKKIEDLRTFLTSEGNKKKFRDTMIQLLQEEYNEDFALGLIEKEQPLAEKIRDLEFHLNEFINSILEKAIGPDWLKEQKYLTDPIQRKECYSRAKLNKRPPWEFINFQTAVNNIIMNKELWPKIFESIFISHERFSTKEELQILTQELWNYRSNILGHKRSVPIRYSEDKLNIIKSAYNIFMSIIKLES